MKKLGENSRISSKRNRGLILKLVATGKCHSRIELSKETELTKMTITNIVKEFRDNDIFIETTERPNEVRGRNPITIEISPDAPKVIGVLIHADYMEVVVCDLQLQIIHRSRKEYPKQMTDQELTQILYAMIDEKLESEKRVLGIGVASLGPLDLNTGTILNPNDFFGIENFEVEKLLKSRYDLPIYVDSDCNSAAVAEALFGNGKDLSDFVYLGLAGEVGSGVIMDGEPFRNHKGYTPEIGHIGVLYEQEAGGRFVSMEGTISITKLVEEMNEATGYNKSFKEYMMDTENEKVSESMDKLIEYLSIGLISAINILHPQAVILGDEGANLPDKYLDKLDELINIHKFIQGQKKIPVMTTAFNMDAQLVGAASNVILEAFKGNLPIV